ncbi:hypothetical protein HMPREF1531_00572 [Propionibacterium sp. oral taxon 192 str. F0372]|uniref:hypothetical protein n=1 Tax=Propionibacterium sp. oral taxon 192 TaxID=671222 RepID=UPI0003527FB6|nr:hypothetical protein [Propionibacterium sp. oral taxon 192]EPH05924.1 hypothetical protein HMPREF1531_00572 [Propionibacterium sp. oral taxon 192 str. F0372]
MNSESMPELFDRLTAKIGEIAAQPEPEKYELSSDRVVIGGDDNGWVTVTMKGFHLDRISYSPLWISTKEPAPEEIASATVKAVNQVIDQFMAEEIADLENHKVPMGELYTGLKEFSGEFSQAYAKVMSRLGEVS